MPANVIVRDPFHEMRDRVRRAFDETLPGWFDESAVATRHSQTQTIPLDVFETDAGLTVEAPLPGFSADEVEVTLEKGKLTVRAEHNSEHSEESEVEGRTYFLRERSQGVISRSILIGDSYDSSSVEGTLKDGVLKIGVKKAPEAQPRRVEIRTD